MTESQALAMEKAIRYLLGDYLKVYIAYSHNRKIRFSSASGGVASELLKYLLERKYVEAVIVPKPNLRRGLVYGVWTIIRNPNEVGKYSGSLYTVTFGLPKMVNYALNKFGRIAVSTLPCHTRALKRFYNSKVTTVTLLLLGFTVTVRPACGLPDMR
jgi:Coenzyme F420-reducing hydrogenase, beta subunit